MLKESVVYIIEDMLSFIVAVVCSDTTSEDKLKDGFMIYDGDRLPILLFELESMDLDWAFSTVSENEPCGQVVGGVLIEITLKLNVTGVGLATEP